MMGLPVIGGDIGGPDSRSQLARLTSQQSDQTYARRVARGSRVERTLEASGQLHQVGLGGVGIDSAGSGFG